MVQPVSTGPVDTLSLAWNGKGPYTDEWIPISVSLLTGSSHSMLATTSSSSSSSSLSSSLSVSYPRSRAYNFCSFFFLLNSFVFLCHSAAVRFTAATSGPFGSGAELSVKRSFFGWSCYPNVSIKGSEV